MLKEQHRRRMELVNEPDQLKERVLREIPERFFRRVWDRQQTIYEEAREHSRTSHLWTSAESDTVWPVARRAAMEHEARLAAKESGLKHIDSEHAGGYPYGITRSAKLALTFHHTHGPRVMVEKCVSRVQNSAVNRFLDQYVMQEMLVQPLPDLRKSGLIYGCVLHGIMFETRAGKTFQNTFMRLAFPDAEFSEYTKNFDIGELLQLYSLIRTKAEDPKEASEDKAKPVLNQKKKKDISGQ